MNVISIRKVSQNDGEKEREFLLSFPEEENGFERPGKGFDLNSYDGFAKFVMAKLCEAKGMNLKDGYVPQTTFWILLDGRLAGVGKVRHYLNDNLRKHGGHIGLTIAPEFRGKGIGTDALKLLVEYAHSLGQDKILLTNNKDNWASRRAVEKNGGVLEKVDGDSSFYWIEKK